MKKLTYFAPAFIAICILIFAGGCAKTLAVPTGLSVDDSYQLTWDSVDNARGYEVEITPTDGSESSFEQTRRTSFSLAELEEGDYGIRIKAISGEDSLLDSEWSEHFSFHKDYENGCTYRLINNNTEYEVAKAGTASGEVIIESTYRGKPVTSIADAAFRGNGKITSIVIEGSVKTIGDSAFYNCTKLVSISIPDSVTEIGVAAFQGCNSLKSIELPQNLTTVSKSLFSYCRGLEEVKLGSRIRTIEEEAFSGCYSLKSIEIPDSVKTIGAMAFQENSELLSVAFGSGLETIEEKAFSACSSLTDIQFSGNSRLYEIGTNAFERCSSLATFPFQSGLRSIGDKAFLSCSALEQVTLPDSVTHIGYNVFSATKFYLEARQAGEPIIFADRWVVGCGPDQDNELTVLTADSLANAVGIADGVFQGFKLENVTFPNTLRYIGSFAFSSNEALWRVMIPEDSVEVIGEGAFAGCSTLTNLILGEGLKTIGAYAFYACSRLDNNVYMDSMIPESVTSIGISAFKLTALWDNADENGIIYAGNWVVGYEGFTGSWITSPSAPTNVVLKADTRGIADYAFYYCTSLKNITGSGIANVRYIGQGAFSECASLATLSLSDNLTEIKDYTFYNCTSLFRVSMPANLVSVGRSAFYNCSTLSEINFSSSLVESIGEFAFYGCLNLKDAKLGSYLKSIGDYAFYKCSSLVSVELPRTVRTVGDSAYYKCTSLISVSFGSGIESIGEAAFSGCGALTSIELPSSVKTVGSRAFYNCSNVTLLILGDGVETIGDYAFYNINKITRLVLPEGLVSVGDYAFRGCAGLTSVLINSSVEAIGAHAFYGCKQLTFYTSAEGPAEDWSGRWNSSFRPVVWGCTMSEDGAYVVSVTIGEGTITDQYAVNGIAAPERADYTFAGWATSPDAEVRFSAAELGNIAPGTTLYAVWTVAEAE